MPLLFCYGSNNPKQLAERVGEPKWTAPAFSRAYKRVFRGWSERWGGGVASLLKSTSRPTFGYVAMVSSSQLSVMDQYEGVGGGYYVRKEIPVVYVDPKTDERVSTKAIAYVATSREFNAPSDKYLDAVFRTIRPFWNIASPAEITVE